MSMIWKFPFETTDMFGLDLPKGAKILTVQTQDGIPCMWVQVEAGQPKEKRVFVIHGTGHLISQPENKKYIDTYQERNGSLVWHLFELIEKGEP